MNLPEAEERPIGLFDSGVGGLTVLRSIRHILPHENLIYFGDTARVPYGGKSRDTILRYSIENAEFLCDQGIKLLVVACNTASAYALPALEQALSIPVIGVIESGVDAVLRASKSLRIAILGTQGTISSEAYQKRVKQRCPEAMVYAIPCPLFVPLIEENFIEHPAARLIVQEYLKALRHARVDALLLGCTHYPVLRDLIQEVVGEHVQIVDSASSCAERVVQKLSEMRALRKSEGNPSRRYYASDDPQKFGLFAANFFGEAVEAVQPCERRS